MNSKKKEREKKEEKINIIFINRIPLIMRLNFSHMATYYTQYRPHTMQSYLEQIRHFKKSSTTPKTLSLVPLGDSGNGKKKKKKNCTEMIITYNATWMLCQVHITNLEMIEGKCFESHDTNIRELSTQISKNLHLF